MASQARQHMAASPEACFAWLDVDIRETRAAYARAEAFVDARNLAYGLSSNRLQKLGGSERKRIKEELYRNDFEWSQKGRIVLKMPCERVTLRLFPAAAPLAVENFLSIVCGEKGTGASGRAMSYVVRVLLLPGCRWWWLCCYRCS